MKGKGDIVLLDLISNRKLRLSIRVLGFFYILFSIWIPVMAVGSKGGFLSYLLPVLSLIGTLILIEMVSTYKIKDDE